jgi:hypothetical protein
MIGLRASAAQQKLRGKATHAASQLAPRKKLRLVIIGSYRPLTSVPAVPQRLLPTIWHRPDAITKEIIQSGTLMYNFRMVGNPYLIALRQSCP